MHDRAKVVWPLSNVDESANVVDRGVFNGHERVYLPKKAPLPPPTWTEDLPPHVSPTPTTKLSPYMLPIRGPILSHVPSPTSPWLIPEPKSPTPGLSLSMLQQQRRDAEQDLRAITAVKVTHWHTHTTHTQHTHTHTQRFAAEQDLRAIQVC
jgi:hypothetical protein